MAVYPNLTDTQLVSLLNGGDRLAYAEIYNRYKAPLYLFAYKRIGQREEARDVIHELFLALWEKHQSLNITTSLLPYLYTATRNRIMDLVSHQQVASRYAGELQQYINLSESPTDHLARHRNMELLIDRHIAALPPKMKQVFELSRQASLSRKQIAEELNLSEETVKSHMHHALKILKTKLGPLFFMVLMSRF